MKIMKTSDIQAVFSKKSRGKKTVLSPFIKKKKNEEDEGGKSGGSTGRGIKKVSFLVDETKAMERAQRLLEQEGHRRLGARVHAREHNTEERQASPSQEGELQNSIPQHPLLDGQRFDGIDPNLNPEPPLNTDARREYDNEKREQEMEKQLRLGNMPKFSSAPTPKPG